MPKTFQIFSDLILNMIIWMIWILISSVTLFPNPYFHCFPEQQPPGLLMMPEIYHSCSLAGPSGCPLEVRGLLHFYPSLLKCQLLMKELLTVYSSPQNSLASHPAFFFRYLPKRSLFILLNFLSLFILHWYASTSDIQQICSIVSVTSSYNNV